MLENVWVLSRIFGSDRPFYEGASCPMVQNLHIDTWEGHGKNGLGDATFPEHTHQDHTEAQKMVQKVNIILGIDIHAIDD